MHWYILVSKTKMIGPHLKPFSSIKTYINTKICCSYMKFCTCNIQTSHTTIFIWKQYFHFNYIYSISKKKKKKKLYLLVDMENYFATVASPEITSSNISFVDPHLQTMFHVKYNGDSRWNKMAFNYLNTIIPNDGACNYFHLNEAYILT